MFEGPAGDRSRDDKKRIEETKGGLLKDSYRWIVTAAGKLFCRVGGSGRRLVGGRSLLGG